MLAFMHASLGDGRGEVGTCEALADDALSKARRVQENASELGFDWTDVQDVLGKVRDEIEEVEQALAAQNITHARSEVGDVLFSAVNLARFVNASPVDELELATQRFSTRFEALKARLQSDGRVIRECTPEELNGVWEEVKRTGNQVGPGDNG